jgi:hypothetical protein
MADYFELAILEVMTMVYDLLGQEVSSKAKEMVRPLTNTVRLLLKALIGLLMSVIDEIYFIL